MDILARSAINRTPQASIGLPSLKPVHLTEVGSRYVPAKIFVSSQAFVLARTGLRHRRAIHLAGSLMLMPPLINGTGSLTDGLVNLIIIIFPFSELLSAILPTNKCIRSVGLSTRIMVAGVILR